MKKENNLYIIKLFISIYMLSIAGQTAGPNGLKLECPGGNIGKRSETFFFKS